MSTVQYKAENGVSFIGSINVVRGQLTCSGQAQAIAVARLDRAAPAPIDPPQIRKRPGLRNPTGKPNASRTAPDR
jgi:hypothetical protein